MPLVKWSKTFELGIYVFDVERMQLLALVNELYDAIVEGVSESAIVAVQNGMTSFAKRHFAHEERYFEISGYAGAEAHKQEHRRLLGEIEKFRQSKASVDDVAYEMNAFLLKWFMDHTKGPDREFCAHLRRLGIR